MKTIMAKAEEKGWDRNGRKIVLASTVIALFLVIGILETIAGWVYENLPRRFNNGKRLVELYLGRKPNIQHSIVSHPYMLYANAPNFFDSGFMQHNSSGYRNEEFQIEKGKNSIRILALGGSTTHMWPYVESPKEIWTYKLQLKLQNVCKKEIQVVNAGQPYATTAELLVGYAFRHRYLKSDIVIIHDSGNDIAPLLFENYDAEYTHFRAHGLGARPRPYERTMLKSNSMKLLYSVWLNGISSIYQSQPKSFSEIDRKEATALANRNNSDGFRRNLDLLIKMVKNDGADVILLGFLMAKRENISRNRPDLKGLEEALVVGMGKHYKIMRELAKRNGVMLIEPDQKLFNDEMFQDNCHLSEKGEAIKADIVFRNILKHGVLKRMR